MVTLQFVSISQSRREFVMDRRLLDLRRASPALDLSPARAHLYIYIYMKIHRARALLLQNFDNLFSQQPWSKR